MFPEALEISCDGLFNIAKRLLAGFALRDAPRQYWTAHDENAVFILVELNSVFHDLSLASRGRLRFTNKSDAHEVQPSRID